MAVSDGFANWVLGRRASCAGVAFGLGLTALGAFPALSADSSAPTSAPSSATASSPVQDGPGGCVVVQNFYFPHRGKEAEALATRLKGAAARKALGLATGRLLVVGDSASGHPAGGKLGPGNASYLMSQIEYESQDAADRAAQALKKSPDYLTVRAHMATLLRHFEMATWRPVNGTCSPDTP